MTQQSNLLFAYGTLLSADTGKTGTSQRVRLAREATVLGVASLPGDLYDLGRYPALVVDDFNNRSAGIINRVHGELLQLADPEHTFKWLDAYEGIVPGNHPHNDYERRQIPVTRPNNTTTVAWVYVWRASLPPTATLVVSGRWLDR